MRVRTPTGRALQAFQGFGQVEKCSGFTQSLQADLAFYPPGDQLEYPQVPLQLLVSSYTLLCDTRTCHQSEKKKSYLFFIIRP